jgi:integrase
MCRMCCADLVVPRGAARRAAGWQKVRAASLTPEQLSSPLMKRPYDLRHSGITWRLNSGVPATEAAAWAGHSVEVLMRIYARCAVGLEGVWIGRMDEALHLGEDR